MKVTNLYGGIDSSNHLKTKKNNYDKRIRILDK